MDFERFLELMKALEAEGVDYILVGGVAVNLHGILRATEDIDLFVRPTAGNVELLRKAMARLWPDPDLAQISASDLAGDYPTVRYGPPQEDFVVDLIGRIGSMFSYEDLAAETVVLEGVRVRVATPATLVRMKRGTIRPQDHADAVALSEKFGLGG